MTGVQLIHQGMNKLKACGPLYGKALSICNAKEVAVHMIWLNFATTINKQYIRMIAKRGRTTLAEDGYEVFNTIASEDTTALTESIMRYF